MADTKVVINPTVKPVISTNPPKPSQPTTSTQPIIASPPFISPINDDAINFFKLSLLGEPGGGKTMLLSTLPEWMYPLGIVDIDDKASSMPIFFELRKKGLVDIFPIRTSILGGDSLKSRLTSKSAKMSSAPMGLNDVVDVINYIRGDGSAAKAAKANGTWKNYKTLAIDTYSRLCEYSTRNVEYLQESDNGLLQGFNDWKRFMKVNEDLCNELVKKATINIIVNCHIHNIAKKNADGTEGKPKWVPSIDGGFRGKFISYFNECYFLHTKIATGGKIEYVIETHKTDNMPARSSIMGIEKTIDVTLPNTKGLAPICELWKKQIMGG
jgi:hypothetical protein